MVGMLSMRASDLGNVATFGLIAVVVAAVVVVVLSHVES